MRTRVSDYNSILEFKKGTAVSYSLWERSFQKLPDQYSTEWTRQLIECRMLLNMGDQGPLQIKFLQALLRKVRKNNRGSPDTPIGFMDHIGAVFEDEGMLELRNNSEHQLVTSMAARQRG